MVRPSLPITHALTAVDYPPTMLPLANVRILDLSWALAGPYATMMLGDLGAEVIKVEALGNYDQARGPVSRRDWRPYPKDRPDGRPFNLSSLFNKPNRNKLGVTLDLNQPEGVDTLKRLVKTCDIVIENFSVRVLKKHGIDWDSLRAIQPDLILVSMPALGLAGPEKDFIAYGSSLEMMAGFVGLRGYGEGAPVRSALNYGDPIAGLNAAGAVLTALHYRADTGVGQHVEVAQLEALAALIGEFLIDYTMNGRVAGPIGNRHPTMAPHNVYLCQGDDAWIAIAVGSDAEWQSLCRVMSKPDLAADPRFATVVLRKQNENELDAIITSWTETLTSDELFQRLASAGLAVGPLRNSRELFEDPQLVHRQFFLPITHPEAGTHRYPGWAAQLSRTPQQIRRPAPTLGQHNREVLSTLLGMSDADIDALEGKQVIGDTPTADVWAPR